MLMWAWDSGLRRAVGVRAAPLKSLVVDERATSVLHALVLVAFINVYVTAGWAS